jgi:hypothetical protein
MLGSSLRDSHTKFDDSEWLITAKLTVRYFCQVTDKYALRKLKSYTGELFQALGPQDLGDTKG